MATMSTTTTRAMAVGPSRSLSLPSVPCTSAKKGHLVKARARLMRSSWIQLLSPLPLTPHQTLTPTSTMPTTLAWPGWQPRASVDSRAHLLALWMGTRGSHSPPFCCQDLHGAFLQRGECRLNSSFSASFLLYVLLDCVVNNLLSSSIAQALVQIFNCLVLT